ncbi:Malate/lactate/ureidoglycolate dehydrogenase, LDH2 family [Ruminococcus sp. YE71]|uniref:Ldh family oxidoreductase n=1 Tax=unclassified Ruminococcus TaxID=2608920 RepID=UPI0008919C35|nr:MULTISPECIES: Ldh family oxidoreductase [unclassified Ruminococcus]SDA24311.1 Malate/lactate/ureidoglycolate dehydrogenase, LDH2 family [Ruminococcus sp. YE78]SFW41801.1 Malate/lactate/ureidoglycolate dehydrogenase, LDH2 family [Ruminococcus sp. YE71]
MSFRAEHNRLRGYITEIFLKVGLSQAYAETVADNLVSAEMRGVRSHGLVQVGNYVGLYKRGVYNISPKVRIVREDDTTAIIDADRGAGAPIGRLAVRKAIDKAKKSGIAAVSVKNATHFGMAAYYAAEAAEQGLIGFAFTNTPPLVAPFDGYKKEIGTNPICAAFPSASGRPIIFDAATSQAAYNKLFFARKEGRKIPLGWAVDGSGRPTDDPSAAIDNGALLPYGGYKGYGLAFIIELLTGILSGSNITPENTASSPSLDSIGQFFIAIDVSRFIDPSVFGAAADSFAARMLDSPQAGEERIFIPGEKEYLSFDDAEKNGLVIYDETTAELYSLGGELGVGMSLDECAF